MLVLTIFFKMCRITIYRMMDILKDILKNTNVPFVEYLQKKGILTLLINSLKHTSVEETLHVAFIIEIIVLILKKTTIRGATQLVREFSNANGYQIVQDAILECEEELEYEPENLRKLFKLTADLVFVGDGYSEYSEGKPIKSQGAFQAIANTFARAKHDTLRREVVDNILFIFAEHQSNYRIVEELGTVAWFIHCIDDYSEETQIAVLKLLEFIAHGLNFIPKEELLSLVELLRGSISPSLAILVLKQIAKFIEVNAFLRTSLREAQLFNVLSHLISTEFETINQNRHRASSTQNSSLSDLYECVISIIIRMLDKMPENIRSFREAGGISALQSMLLKDDFRDLALKVFQTIILQDTHSIDVNILIEILQTAPRSNISLKIAIFNALGNMFLLKESAKDAFREAGFVAAISVIINTPWPLKQEEIDAIDGGVNVMLKLFETLFSTLACSLTNHPLNKSLLTKLIGVTAITDALRVNGILKSEYSYHAFQCLLDFATERTLKKENEDISFGRLTVAKNARILNPHAFRFILILLEEMEDNFRYDMMKVFEYLSRLTPVNLEALSSIELIAYIYDHFQAELIHTSHPSHSTIIKIIEGIGCYRMSQHELRTTLALLQSKEHQPAVQKFLIMAAKESSSTPFVNMEPDSACSIVALNERSWGSSLTGYSFGCWFYFNNITRGRVDERSEGKLFDLLALSSEDKKSYLKISMRDDGYLEVKLASKAKKILFSSFTFLPKKWYNVVITHKKFRLQGSSMALHVNGVLTETQKTPFVTYCSSGGSKMRGTIGKNPPNSNTILRMGSSFLYEDVLGLNTISSIYVAGPSYSGYYQGNYVSSMHLLSEHLYTNFIKLLQNQGSSDNLSPTSEVEAENALRVMPHPLSEDKFVFCLNPRHSALREIENSARDNSTSSGVFLETLHTDSGVPRVLVSNAHCCCPASLSDEILNCDGLGAALALIDRAESSEALLDALSLLANLMLDSPKILNEMDRLSAYDMVGSFLRRKGFFMNEAIHDLLWKMVLMGSRNGRELVTNLKACVCFLFDYEIWKKAPPHVQQKPFQKMSLLIAHGDYKRWNALRFDKIGIVPHLLLMLTNHPPIEILDAIVDVIAAQMSENMTIEHVTYLKEYLLLTLDSEHTLGTGSIKPPTERRRSLSSVTTLTLRKSSKRTPLSSFLRISGRNLLLKMLLDLVKIKSSNLDKLYRAVDFKWFYQFVNEKSHPVSAIIAVQLWCCVALYNPTNMNNEKMLAILKQGLAPYCNQTDMYQALFSLILSRYARFNDKSDNFELLLKSNKESKINKEPKIAFPQMISSLLNMLKHNLNDSYRPSYDNLAVHSYFTEVGPMDAGIDKWKYFKLGMSPHEDLLYFGRDTASPQVVQNADPESFYSNDQKEERQQLSLTVVQFLRTLHQVSPSFRSELRKPEILVDLIAVLFANHHPELLGASGTVSPTIIDANIAHSILTDTESRQTTFEDCKTLFSDNSNSIIQNLFTLITEIVVAEFNTSGKGLSVIDDILSSCPKTAAQVDCSTFRATVLENLMTRFSAEENAREIEENSKLATNIAYFTMYVADMYKYCVLPTPKYPMYMKFIIQMIGRYNALEMNSQKNRSKLERNFMQWTSMLSNATSGTGINIDPLALTVKDVTITFRALNKMIIHLLTMYDDIESALIVLDHLLLHDWLVVAVDANNKERDFFICLCFILHNALVHEDERIRNRGLSCWRILISAQRSMADNILSGILSFKNENNESVSLLDGFSLLLDRDITPFLNWHSNNPFVVPFFESRVGNEARNLMEGDRKTIRASMGTLFQKGRGRSDSAVLKKEKKSMETYTILSRECQHAYNVIKEQGESTAKTRVEQDVIRYKYALDQWNAFKRQLHMERAIWYDKNNVKLLVWALNSTEGPQRIRKKFEMMQEIDNLLWSRKSQNVGGTAIGSNEKNEQSTLSLIDQYKKFEGLKLVSKSDSSSSPQKDSSQMTELDATIDDSSDGEGTSELNDHSDTDALNESHDLNSETEVSESTFEDDLQEDLDFLDEEMGEYFKIRRLLDPGENMTNSQIFNSLKVTGLDGQKGIIVLCQHNMYIIDNFMLTKDEKIIEVDGSHVTSATFDEIPNSPDTNTSTSGSGVGSAPISHHVIRISYSELTQVLKRRYLLRVTALEFFCQDGRNYFVVFEKSEMETIFNKIISQSDAKNINKGPSQKHMTLLWQKGEISNFEYLMYLNTLAGRTYNDLTQYPVFPWILKEYTTEELDLNDPNIYRDLSRPMGAQTEERSAQFRQRFNDWPVETGIPKFHYGSHYSSAGIVLHYLMRIEPFTTQSIELQGGKFDHADRMFHSVHDTWMSASTDYSMADVKELIPEFFYLPEFLINSNDVDFGRRQNHTRVNNVVLPPWAKGDPFEFIRIHRLALESDYVSEHIHDWIDLIFGYKQKGKDAEEAINIFYYLTYEGAVDIDAITNDVDRQATIAQISNFGQTPHQLFTTPHPKRNAGQLAAHAGPNVVAELLLKKQPVPLDPSVISYKCPLDNKQLLFLSLDQIEGRICTASDIVFMNFTPSNDKSLKPRLLNNNTMMKTPYNCVGQIAPSKNDIVALRKNCFMWGNKATKYFSYGHPDNSLRISRIGDDHHHADITFENLHTSQISCATCTDDRKTLITGGEDSAVSVWKLERTKSGKSRKTNITLRKRLCGHYDTITCLAASTAFSIIVSGSKDGACIVWDLNTLRYIRLLEHQTLAKQSCSEDFSISCMAISACNGDIAVCINNTIYVWSINGALLTSVDTRASKITAICLSHAPKWYNDNFIVTGHEDGSIKIWVYDFSSPINPSALQEEFYTSDSAPNGIASASGLFGSLCLKLHSTKHLNTAEVTYIHITEDLHRIYAGDSVGTVTRWEVSNKNASS